LTTDEATLQAFLASEEACDENGDHILYDKKGKLRDNEAVRSYQAIITRAETEPLLASGMKTWAKQAIFTGKIAGLPWKVMLDFWKPDNGGIIMDLKFMCDFKDDWATVIGDNGLPRSVKVPWYDAAGYFRSMATYREVVFQNTTLLPLVALYAFTKQDPPDAMTVSFDDQNALDRFDRELKEVERKLPEFEAMKRGELVAPGCDSPECDFCRSRHTLDRVVTAMSYRDVTME